MKKRHMGTVMMLLPTIVVVYTIVFNYPAMKALTLTLGLFIFLIGFMI